MIGEEPSQKYWILSLPVEVRDLHSKICCFSDHGNINIFKERFIQEFLIFCKINYRETLIVDRNFM